MKEDLAQYGKYTVYDPLSQVLTTGEGKERKMINPDLELVNTAYTTQQLPQLELPQVAMAGRSNVGKSSLINALAGRKKLAKVSSSPGKTRSVNFYLVRPYDFYLVDLPGYGYARASHDERKHWANVLENYISLSRELRSLILLLDCRIPPQKLDMDLGLFAEAHNIPVLPVLTKIDKCKQRERDAKQKEWQEILGIKPLMVSSQKRTGLEKLWKHIIIAATGKIPEGMTTDKE